VINFAQDFHFYFHLFYSQMKVLLLFSSLLLLCSANSEKSDERQGRVLNRRNGDHAQFEKQVIEEYQAQASSINSTATDASFDDVIDEIIYSSREGRNIEGLDGVYGDLTIKEALSNGNEIEARNLIRDKLCDLGLMQCDEVVHGKRPGYPTRVIYSQPPPGAVIYNSRPPPPPPGAVYSNRPGPPPQHPQHQHQQPQLPLNGIYGPAKPIPMPQKPNPNHLQQQQHQPPRKIGFAHSDYNNFGSSSNEKFSTADFFEADQSQSAIKFGYTEKPTIVVNQNQGKREAAQTSNHHVHHHYVHVDGSTPNAGGLIDGTKTVLVNTPISEYSAVNSLSSSYQTSGYGSSGAASNINNNGGFAPMNSLDYKGVNSGSSGIYSGSSLKPVYESNQYAGATDFNKYQPSLGPQAVYTEGTNGIYSNGVQQSFHSTAPDFYKKELNLNTNNRGSGYATQQQQTFYNPQKQQQQSLTQQQQSLYSKNQYNSYGDKYQGFETGSQDQFDCVCVPFDQCPAHDVVGRRDDLILPLDPRNLPTDIEADTPDSNSTIKVVATRNATEETLTGEVKKISKRNVPTASDDVRKVQGEGVSRKSEKLVISSFN
jgi:hypothetical protein